MKRFMYLYAGAASLMVFASDAFATPVPEIDGSGAVLALGVTAGLVALIRDRKR